MSTSSPAPISVVNLKAETRFFEAALLKATQQVLRSGFFILGPEVSALETELAASIGKGSAAATSNGTDALYLALKALGVKPGDEILTVPNTAVPTVTAILMCRAIPRFVDIDSKTNLMDTVSLKKAWTKRCKGVIPVHLYGQMAPMKAILAQAKAHRAFVLEDCAQAQGATQDGKPCGSFGDAAAFSFYPTKNLGALGDGGLVYSKDAALIAQIKMLRNYGMQPGYQHDSFGTNKRMDDLQAAYLRVKFKKLDWLLSQRRAYASAYLHGIKHPHVSLPVTAKGNKHTYHLFVVRVSNRADFQAHLKSHGVQSAIHYPKPIPKQGFMRQQKFSSMALPCATAAAAEYVTLPLHPFLSASEVQRVIKAVNLWPV